MLKKRIFTPIVIGGLLTAALLSFAFARAAFSNSETEFTEPAKVIIPEKKAIEAPKINVIDFKAAAQQNAQLKNSLQWTFGGKPQTGWYLYVPLIQHLTGTEAAPESEDFAIALAKWQQRSNIADNGILESKTLNKMIGFWQSQRLNRSNYPAENELLTAPPTDFFDSGREAELRKVKRDAYEAYQRMVAAAMADKSLQLNPKSQFLKIVSAFRPREYQEKLRQQSPTSGRAGLAVNSPHFTGCALDIYVGGEPVSTRDENRAVQVQTPAYRWLVKNAEKFGFYPYYYEPWHWEYRDCR